MEKNPFIGAMYSVVLSLAKLTASGGDISRAWLTLQEYFERMRTEESWGKPLAALLGAWWAQRSLGTPAIGGKDSMSGSFENLNVPPTLVSFALTCEKADSLISPELKKAGSTLYRARIRRGADGTPDFESVKAVYAKIYEAVQDGKVYSAYAVERGGVLAAVTKMALGNGIGAKLTGDIGDLSAKAYGDIILEGEGLDFEVVGTTGGDAIALSGEAVPLDPRCTKRILRRLRVFTHCAGRWKAQYRTNCLKQRIITSVVIKWQGRVWSFRCSPEPTARTIPRALLSARARQPTYSSSAT